MKGLGYMLATFPTFGSEVVLISDPRVLAISIQENNEPWVDLRNQTTIKIGPSPEIPNNEDYTWLRKTVFEKLKMAEKSLPRGMHFCLYEGYRSISLQKMLFDKQFSEVEKRHPDWSREEVFKETTKLVSPVVNLDGTDNIPPHSTGAAIDVYLIDEKGNALDMGIHPKDWMKDLDGSLSLTDSKVISLEAKKNREIMNNALQAQDFVNYPTEYWHWSYGDRYWAYVQKAKYAIYASK